MQKPSKFAFNLIIAVVLTLGLSISFQSLLAAWNPPTANPPDGNALPPITVDGAGNTNPGTFTAAGTITANTITATAGYTTAGNIVASGNVGIGVIPDGSYKLHVAGGAIGSAAYLPLTTSWSTYGTGDGGAAIYNDAGTYQALMIVGADRGQGYGRWVRVWDSLWASSRVDSPIYYDADDLAYYVNPNGSSIINDQSNNTIHTGYLDFRYAGGDSGQGNNAYAIFQEGGAWAHPYPDLRIAYHTGIKLGANSSYNGIRFYNDYDMSTLVMSVNDVATGGANNVWVENQLSAGSFVYHSDEILKKDIQTIPDALQKVLELKGVEFTWKESGEESVGLIAQDVEKVFPELVETGGNGLKGVQYGNLVAPLIEAVKEQQAMIKSLEERISELEKKSE